MTNKWPKSFGKDCTEWPPHSEAELSHVTETDWQTPRTLVTIVCISYIWCCQKVITIFSATACIHGKFTYFTLTYMHKQSIIRDGTKDSCPQFQSWTWCQMLNQDSRFRNLLLPVNIRPSRLILEIFAGDTQTHRQTDRLTTCTVTIVVHELITKYGRTSYWSVAKIDPVRANSVVVSTRFNAVLYSASLYT